MNNNQGRKRVRRAQKKSQINRVLLMICMMALVAAVSIGGTIAWLTDDTEAVINTFTEGDVDIIIDETGADEGDEGNLEQSFQMVPGRVIDKEPYVQVLANSEKSWVFVKVEETANFDDFMTYEIDGGWTLLRDNIYYRIVNETKYVKPETGEYMDSDWLHILKDDQVVVKETVTKEDMDKLSADNYPKLTFTAYAIQYEGFEPVITEGASDFTKEQELEAAQKAWAAINTTSGN